MLDEMLIAYFLDLFVLAAPATESSPVTVSLFDIKGGRDSVMERSRSPERGTVTGGLSVAGTTKWRAASSYNLMVSRFVHEQPKKRSTWFC